MGRSAKVEKWAEIESRAQLGLGFVLFISFLFILLFILNFIISFFLLDSPNELTFDKPTTKIIDIHPATKKKKNLKKKFK